MILPVLMLLALAGAALGSAVPMAIGAARQGRQSAWILAADAAARAGLAEAESGAWSSVLVTLGPGQVLALPPLDLGRWVHVTREVRLLGGGLCLITARAERWGGGGELLAASEQGLLVRLVQTSAGLPPQVVPTSRPWLRRPQ